MTPIGLGGCLTGLPLDAQFANRIDTAQAGKGQMMFMLDNWAAQVNTYDNFFTEVDKEKYRECPVLVPINDRDECLHLLPTIGAGEEGRREDRD